MIREPQNLIGSSEVWLQVLAQVSALAPLNRPILVVGERGTGKELLTSRLHYLSKRWQQPYVQVNCAVMQENLLESELFGHEAGAFTGATRSHAGLFERADGGSLFLDELPTASTAVQEKLLRVIEYGQFTRLGGNKNIQVDVRVIAASNCDLPALAASGKFREDLLDRLAFDVINLPPLRYRRDVIPLLAEHFALRMCMELGYDYFAGFTPSAIAALCQYAWPGNVRELKNVVERSIYRQGSATQPVATIVFDPFVCDWRQESLPSVTGIQETVSQTKSNPAANTDVPPLPCDLKHELAISEQQWLIRALQKSGFQQKRAATLLGLTYDQLRAALRKYPHLLANRQEH